jgi:hypothetical protein
MVIYALRSPTDYFMAERRGLAPANPAPSTAGGLHLVVDPEPLGILSTHL